MAVHPKVGLIATVMLFGVCTGLALFLLGRMTADERLMPAFIGTGVGLLILGAIGVGVARHLPSSARLQSMTHHGAQNAEDGYVSSVARLDLVGKSGTSLTELRPVGTAEIAGERVVVTTDGEFVQKGTALTVVRADGMRVVVRPAARLNA